MAPVNPFRSSRVATAVAPRRSASRHLGLAVATLAIVAAARAEAQRAATPPAPPPATRPPAPQGGNAPGCDAKLLGPGATSASGYRVRGRATRWCEGVYATEVGNIELKIEGFTRPLSVAKDRVDDVDTVFVEWQAPPGSEVRLLGRSRAKGYYQLDAVVRTDSTGAGRWAWPSDVLRELDAYPFSIPLVNARPEVWVQAQTVMAGAAGARDSVHVPVRLTVAGDTRAPARDLELRLFTPVRLEEMTVRLQRPGPTGALVDVAMRRDCPSPFGGTGGRDPVVVMVCLPPDAPGALYTLTVGADAAQEMVRSRVVRFWIRGSAR